MIAKCDECGADISVPQDAIVGEIVECKDCGAEYEVSSLENETVHLKPAEVAEEDWGE